MMKVTERCLSSPVWAVLRNLILLAALLHWPACAGACKTSAECRGREICLDQVCTCPVLFKGPGCKAPRPPVSKGCLVPFTEWPKKGYNPRGIDFSRCAVVGSSSILKGSKHGKTVDAATAVFRFNEAPTKGHEKDVGSWKKATIRMQNKERGGFAEKGGERCVVWSTNDYRKKVSGKGCTVTTMGNALEEYVGTYFAKYSSVKKKKGAVPISNQMAKMSNGFLGIVIALHLCARVDIVGFDQGEGYYFKKFVGVPKGWGAPKSIKPSTRPFKERHSWDRERACVNTLGVHLPAVTVHRKGYKKPLRPFIPEPANPEAATASVGSNGTTLTPTSRYVRPTSVAFLRAQVAQEQQQGDDTATEAAGVNGEQQQQGAPRPAWHVKRWRDSLAAARSAGDSVVQTGPRQVTKLGSRPRPRAALDGSAAGAAPKQDGNDDNVAKMLYTLSA